MFDAVGECFLGDSVKVCADTRISNQDICRAFKLAIHIEQLSSACGQSPKPVHQPFGFQLHRCQSSCQLPGIGNRRSNEPRDFFSLYRLRLRAELLLEGFTQKFNARKLLA